MVPDRYPEGKDQQGGEGDGARKCRDAEMVTSCLARHRSPCHRESPPSCRCRLRADQDQTQCHQGQGERTGRRGVEPISELGEDLRGERLKSQGLEGAVLGQNGQGDEQAAAEQDGTDLAQRHPKEHGHPGQTQTDPDLLHRRVRASQTGRYG